MVDNETKDILGRHHPVRWFTLCAQVAMQNYTYFALLYTSYLMQTEEVVGVFPYPDNPDFNLKLHRVMLWCSLIFAFLVPCFLILIHIVFFFLKHKNPGDYIRMPLILAAIPFGAQFIIWPLMGPFLRG